MCPDDWHLAGADSEVLMYQPRRSAGTGVALLLVLLGMMLAFAADIALGLLLSEHILNAWQNARGARLYLLEFGISTVVGVVLALPVLLTRPRSIAVPIIAAAVSIPIGVAGDLTFSFANSLYYDLAQHLHLSPFSGFGAYFTAQTTVSLISYLMSPVAAGLLTALRVWRVRSAERTDPALWGRPPYQPGGTLGPYGGTAGPYGSGPTPGGPGRPGPGPASGPPGDLRADTRRP
jgi:hypothetical protein